MVIILRIGFDCRHNLSGIGSYITNLLEQFSTIDSQNEFVLFGMVNSFTHKKNFHNIPMDIPIYNLKEQFVINQVATRSKLDLLHIPHYNIPIAYKGNIITTVHDIIHLKFPEFLPNKLAYYYAKYLLKSALKKSKKIITVSENTKRDLIDFFQVDAEKIETVYNGVSDRFTRIHDQVLIDSFKQKRGITKPYILCVGNVRPHKNINRLVQAYKELYKINQRYLLVIVGEKRQSMSFLEDHEGLIFTGYIDDNDLITAYNGADLFIYPSLYEGFGIPPLEAMKCGVPVACSNSSSLPEVVGQASILFDPYDIGTMVKAMLNGLIQKDLRAKLIEEGFRRAALFTWEEAAQKTLNIYNKVLTSG